jgi:hypothetical protein
MKKVGREGGTGDFLDQQVSKLPLVLDNSERASDERKVFVESSGET